MQSKARRQLLEDLSVSRRGMLRDFLVGAVHDLGETELTLTQLAALAALGQGEEEPLSAMAKMLGRSLSATSRLVDQLVRRRLLSRREDQADRRARRIALAPEGQRFLASLVARRAEAQLDLITELNPEERARVAEGTALLADAVRRRAARIARGGGR